MSGTLTTMVVWMNNNWAAVVGIVAVIILIAYNGKRFLQLTPAAQRERIRKCLLAWVVQAEAELGGGTGRVKLSTVYGIFVTTFPIIKNFVSFDTFSLWVDDALDEMREMLSNNESLKQVVEGIQLVEVGEGIVGEQTN